MSVKVLIETNQLIARDYIKNGIMNTHASYENYWKWSDIIENCRKCGIITHDQENELDHFCEYNLWEIPNREEIDGDYLADMLREK